MNDNPTQELDTHLAVLIAIAVEGWRLHRAVGRTAENLDADQKRRLASRLAYFEQSVTTQLDKVGLKLVEYGGHGFGPELPVAAVNASDFAAEEPVVIAQTLEPAVLGPSGVLKMGSVTLRRAAL